MLQEIERRVLANLSEPRSLPNLTRVVRSDFHGPFDDRESFDATQERVAAIVATLTERGLIVELGSHSEGKSALRAVVDNAEAIDLPKVKADALRRRLDSGRDSRLDTGPLMIASRAGLAELTA